MHCFILIIQYCFFQFTSWTKFKSLMSFLQDFVFFFLFIYKYNYDSFLVRLSNSRTMLKEETLIRTRKRIVGPKETPSSRLSDLILKKLLASCKQVRKHAGQHLLQLCGVNEVPKRAPQQKFVVQTAPDFRKPLQAADDRQWIRRHCPFDVEK